MERVVNVDTSRRIDGINMSIPIAQIETSSDLFRWNDVLSRGQAGKDVLRKGLDRYSVLEEVCLRLGRETPSLAKCADVLGRWSPLLCPPTGHRQPPLFVTIPAAGSARPAESQSSASTWRASRCQTAPPAAVQPVSGCQQPRHALPMQREPQPVGLWFPP
eukprot:scaffold3649_cov30-Tisochrysis_lutea.AAC.5